VSSFTVYCELNVAALFAAFVADVAAEEEDETAVEE
jgi:hypothetical protein